MTKTKRAAVAALAMAGALAVLGGACSGDDEKSSNDKSGDSKSTTSSSVAPPSTVSDAEFEANIASYTALLANAGTDPCKVMQVFAQNGTLAPPANPTQTEQGVGLIAELFRALSKAPPAGAESDAPTMASAADRILTEGEANGWDPKWLTEGEGQETLQDQEFLQAFTNYQTKYQEQCGAQSGASTSVP